MLDLLWVGKGVNLCSFYGLRPLTLKIARFHPARAKYGVIPAMLLSRNPGVMFALYFCTFVLYGLRPLTSWRFTHTRPRGNQRLFPLGTPSRPATFSNSEKVAMGIDPALDFICSMPRPYSKMLTLPMGRPFPSKASQTSMSGLTTFSSTASSSELNLSI